MSRTVRLPAIRQQLRHLCERLGEGDDADRLLASGVLTAIAADIAGCGQPFLDYLTGWNVNFDAHVRVAVAEAALANPTAVIGERGVAIHYAIPRGELPVIDVDPED